VDYALAYGCTVARVHYQQDNLAGLNIGQRIIREKLPNFLEKNYGYDSAKVFDSKEETIKVPPSKLAAKYKDCECNNGKIAVSVEDSLEIADER
jgi:hypothetical protein